jgi:hypothetical protein
MIIVSGSSPLFKVRTAPSASYSSSRWKLELVNEDINLTSSDSLKFLFPIQYSSNYQNQIRIIKFTFYFIEDKVEYDPLTNIITNEVNINGN